MESLRRTDTRLRQSAINQPVDVAIVPTISRANLHLAYVYDAGVGAARIREEQPVEQRSEARSMLTREILHCR
jgi:hypothetical protein